MYRPSMLNLPQSTGGHYYESAGEVYHWAVIVSLEEKVVVEYTHDSHTSCAWDFSRVWPKSAKSTIHGLHDTHDMAVKDEIERLLKEYGKLKEPWKFVADAGKRP
jgi:hypothetical protein